MAVPSRLSALRPLSQGAFLLFTLWVGYRFFLFYQWAMGQRPVMVPRPPAVEGFLPISALLGLRRLLATGHWDMVHPAGLTILLTALLIALLARKGFCGWICPVGALSNLVERLLGHRTLTPPRWLEYPLFGLKYLLLVFFLYTIFWRMTLPQVEGFMATPYNLAADAKMLLFFLAPSPTAGWILAGLIVLSVVVRNAWCRYLCPYGALLGLVALLSPAAVRRDPERCVDCRRCHKVCPAGIPVHQRHTVRDCECVGCLDCVAACPKRECLTVTTPVLQRPLPFLALPAAVLGLFFAAYLTAMLTGHWQSRVPADTLAKTYRAATTLSHPSF